MRELIKKYFPAIVEPDLQEKIASVGEVKTISAGEVIMDINRYIRSVPLVMEGIVKVIREDEEGNELLLYYLETGDTCAMSFTCCMANKRSEIRATAETDVAMIALPVAYMDDWMFQYKGWKNFVMTTYNKRFHEMLATIDSIAFKKMDERLVRYLKDKAQTTKSTLLNTTHQDIATELNTSREVVSRLLKQLEKDKVIQLGRNKIQLLHL